MRNAWAVVSLAICAALGATAAPQAQPKASAIAVLSRKAAPKLSDAQLEAAIRAKFAKSKSSSTFTVRVQGGVAHIDGKTDVIGYVFAINGKINSADVYASSSLFKKLWPKLLNASAIEATAELQRGEKFAAPKADAIKGFLDDSSKGTDEKQKDVSSRVQMVTRESKENVFFETRDRAKSDTWVHRNYIKKN